MKKPRDACTLAIPRYTAGMGRSLVLIILLTVGPVQANNITASNCLVRLNQLVGLLGTTEAAASNDTFRAEYIAEHRIKIKGLTEIAQTYFDALTIHLSETNTAAADNDQTTIQTACNRAEKLAAEVADFQTTGDPKSKSPLPALVDPTTGMPTIKPPSAPVPAIPHGDEFTCLRQAKLAALLAQAMGSATTTPVQMLTQQGIVPPAGWRAEACVTLGDFCVVVAQLLKLKVAEPVDPAHCIEAVRNDGLPVDAFAAHEPRAVLHEAEVRAFLARGYAVVLPSSRLIQPE